VDVLESIREELRGLSDLTREVILEQRRLQARQRGGSLNHFGASVFSQADEDGITLEIVRRLKLPHGQAIEIGVGSGTQNNTLILLALGWKAIWLGNESLRYSTDSSRVAFRKCWVTVENVERELQLAAETLRDWNEPTACDVLSVDIDGNDVYVTEKLLKNGWNPSLIIIEYNPLLPPPIAWARDYAPSNTPRLSHYGASLQFICDALQPLGYHLLACALQNGNNAFFVADRHLTLFPEASGSIENIYVGRGLGSYNFPVSGKPWDNETLRSLVL
jgi:hypothetical protein